MTTAVRAWACFAAWAVVTIIGITYALYIAGPKVESHCAARGVRGYTASSMWATSLQLRDDPTCKKAS